MHDEIHAIVRTTANRLAKKWKQDKDDIAQELYLWILAKLDYTFFENFYASAKDEDDEEEFDGKLKRFKSSIHWAGERYCRQEKAETEGYSVQDEYFYSIAQLASLLPSLIGQGVAAAPPAGRGDSVRRPTDAAEGGGYLASMVDLDVALSKLDKRYRDRLLLRYGPLVDLSDESIAGLSQSEIVQRTGLHPTALAESLGVTKDQVASRVKTSLVQLQKLLGGRSPWRTPDWPTAA